MSRQYYGVEDLGLTASQRQTLVGALQRLGRNNQHPNPSHRNHWRVRLDNKAVIFEADFNDDDWTVEGLRNRLATLFGINPNLITTSTAQTQYGPVVMFRRTTPRLRMIAFGGLLADYSESHDVVLDYLANNIAEWEEAII